MSLQPKQFTLQAEDMKKPVQLPMFMPAQELRDSLTATADMPNLPVDDVLDLKLTDSMRPKAAGAHGSGVFASVQEKGVLSPVQMIHGDNDLMLGQGHHRVAAADFDAGLNKKDQYVPVVHTDARSDTPIGKQDDEGYGVRSAGVRRAAISDMREFDKNTGSWYRNLKGMGEWTD
jgi:hypothetical protein